MVLRAMPMPVTTLTVEKALALARLLTPRMSATVPPASLAPLQAASI